MWLIAFMVIFVGTIIIIGGTAAWRERRLAKKEQNPAASR
jgi:predicted negative regulator of RcsB-dependent stress response